MADLSVRHEAFVRVTHWVITFSFLALLLSGAEILISHPRFYWGEAGNARTAPLFKLPIPASRHSVPTGYGFVLPDQNGWSRYLHFQSAWAVVLTGGLYVGLGLVRGHFRRNLVPRRGWLGEGDAWSYNSLQRLTYLVVIFVLFPLIIWTGLAMSPAVASAMPVVVTAFGGQQSARTIHFFVTLALVAFLLVHVVLVWLAGFRNRVRAMITGRV
jgi:thiosulfate reductase cytochrome b subunit